MNNMMEYVDSKHILSQDERNQMGLNLASKHIEVGDLLEEKKANVSQYTAKIDAKKAEISLLSTQINNGYVILSVYAEKRRNFTDKVWEWIDPNTGEIVKTEPFMGNDFQMRTDDVDYRDIPQDPDVQDVEHTEILLLGAPGVGEEIEFTDVDSSDVDDDHDDDDDDNDNPDIETEDQKPKRPRKPRK